MEGTGDAPDESDVDERRADEKRQRAPEREHAAVDALLAGRRPARVEPGDLRRTDAEHEAADHAPRDSHRHQHLDSRCQVERDRQGDVADAAPPKEAHGRVPSGEPRGDWLCGDERAERGAHGESEQPEVDAQPPGDRRGNAGEREHDVADARDGDVWREPWPQPSVAAGGSEAHQSSRSITSRAASTSAAP